MNSSPRFGLRNSLNPMHAALPAQVSIHIFTRDRKDDLLEASDSSLVGTHDLDLPPSALGKMGVHSEQICSEEGCLIATGSGTNFHDDVFPLHGIGGDEEHLALLLQHGLSLFERGEFFLGHRYELIVVLLFHHHLSCGDLLLEGSECA